MLLSRKNIPALNNIVTFQFLHGGVLLCTALFIICQRYFMLAGAPMGQERKIISHPVTLVTAYYPLSSGSKHSLEDYMKWTSNLFGHTRAPIVAYLPAGNISQTIREMRGDLPLTIKVGSFLYQDVDLYLRKLQLTCRHMKCMDTGFKSLGRSPGHQTSSCLRGEAIRH